MTPFQQWRDDLLLREFELFCTREPEEDVCANEVPDEVPVTVTAATDRERFPKVSNCGLPTDLQRTLYEAKEAAIRETNEQMECRLRKRSKSH